MTNQVDLNEFIANEQQLTNRLLNELIHDDLEYAIANFIISLSTPLCYYERGKGYPIFSIITECFLDQISYENRQEYMRLIYLVVPEELKGEIRKCIKNSSVVFQHFPLEYDFLESL
jgi:hypothetical protein